jgi:hypothetical protein
MKDMYGMDQSRLYNISLDDLHRMDNRFVRDRKDYHALVKSVHITAYSTKGCDLPVYVDWYTGITDPEKDDTHMNSIKISKADRNTIKGLTLAMDEMGMIGTARKPGENYLSPPMIVEPASGYYPIMPDHVSDKSCIPLHNVPCSVLHNAWFNRLIGFNYATFMHGIQSDTKNVSDVAGSPSVIVVLEPDTDTEGFASTPSGILAWMIYTFHSWWIESTNEWISLNKEEAKAISENGIEPLRPLTNIKGVRWMLVVKEVLDIFINQLKSAVPQHDVLSNLTGSGLHLSFGSGQSSSQAETRINSTKMRHYSDTPLHLTFLVEMAYLPLTRSFPEIEPPTHARRRPRRIPDEMKTSVPPAIPVATTSESVATVTVVKDKYEPSVVSSATDTPATSARHRIRYVDPHDL